MEKELKKAAKAIESAKDLAAAYKIGCNNCVTSLFQSKLWHV
jgi:hypothetical protein